MKYFHRSKESEYNPNDIRLPNLTKYHALQTATSPSPGPLLTGQIAMDTAFGFIEEIATITLVLYAIYIFCGIHTYDPLIKSLPVAGAILTAAFLFWHGNTMGKRYSYYAQGRQKGRLLVYQTRRHLLTFVIGVMMLVPLFPLGGLLLYVGGRFGTIGWLLGIFIAYCLGLCAQRQSKKAMPQE